METKLLLVGWDAADWKIIQRLIDTNLMPHTRRLVEGGVMANLSTLSPVLSPMLWTSIATGKRAHKHGIHGFIEPLPDGKGVRPVTNLSRKCKAVWNILCQNEKKCNVVGWWPSSPVEPINGVMVSNHYQRATQGSEPQFSGSSRDWKMPPDTVHPTRLRDELAELRWHPKEITEEYLMPFVPNGADIDQSSDRRLENLVKVIADCTSIQSCATHLLETEPWDFMAVYFDAIDHFSHAFMRYHPPRLDWVSEADYEMYKNVVTAGYVYHDMMLGRLMELADDDTTIMLISDHGFHPDHLRLQKLPLEPAGPAAEHREHGIFVLNGPGIKKDELIHGIGLLDIAPTILTLFGLPVGEDLDGRVILSAFEDDIHVSTIPSWDLVEGESGQHPQGFELAPEASENAIDQLVELGYIERPSDDNSEAVEQAQVELDYNLARSYIDAGMHGEAAPLLVCLYQKQPLEFRFGIQLAMCLQALNQVDDLARLVTDMKSRWAIAAVAARKRLVEFNEIAKERRAHTQKLAAGESGQETESSDDESIIDLDDSSDSRSAAQRLFSEKEKSAIRKVRGVAQGNPGTLEYLSGWVAMSQGNHEEALKFFSRAKSSDSVVPGFYFHLAETYRNLEQYDEALANYERVLELDPENAGAHLGLSRLYLNQHQNSLAFQSAKTALGLRYNLPPAHYCVAVCEFRRSNFEAAFQALEEAISLNPNFVEAYDLMVKINRDHFDDATAASSIQQIADEVRSLNQQKPSSTILPELVTRQEGDFEEKLPQISKPKREQLPTLLEQPEPQAAEARPANDSRPIIIISGLPRSGTSLMMQMVMAAGIEPMADDQRVADENNLKGYFELERVKSLAQDNTWIPNAVGKSLKVVAPLIPFLPQALPHKVIMMQRDMEEVLHSQRRMLERLKGKQSKLSDFEIISQLEKHFELALNVLSGHDVPFIVVSHAQAIAQPEVVAKQVSKFLGVSERIDEMKAVVERSMYRETHSSPKS